MIILALLSAIIPLILGVILYFVKTNKIANRIMCLAPSVIGLIISIIVCVSGTINPITIFKITSDIKMVFRSDVISNFFAILVSLIMSIVTIYSFEYFKEDERKNKFDAFFVLSYAALMFLCYSGNLITMYITFEMVTLLSMPLVLHEKTKESIDAALKYLIYSIAGAFLGFIGVVYLTLNTSGDFVLGGSLNAGVASQTSFQVIVLLMLIGFGAKCGLFPLHNWLPSAHPVAPAPASSVLSGIITKSGVFAIIRIVYYTIGTNSIFGTWVHYTWLILIMITILLGSYMAAVQKNLKKRLAFSSVSQISYVLLGIAMLNEEAFAGGILQVASHACIKVGLFLVAGVMIHNLHIHDVEEMEGVGKKMPITMWCYTICSLGLIGVPPTSGFSAKWNLAIGSINSGLKVINIIAPIVLIISAILTAYYLLSCTIKAFFPSNKEVVYEKVHEPKMMIVPLIVLTTLVVLVGIFAWNIASFIQAGM